MTDGEKFSTVVLGLLGALAATALLFWGAYELGWVLQEESVNRSAVISDNSVNRESALRAEANQLHDEILDLDVIISFESSPELEAQRAGLLDRFCDSYEQVDNIEFPTSVEEFATEEC